MHIATQMSLYPLRQPRLSPAIETVWKVLEKNQLDFKKGRMSTVISGEVEVVFGAPFMFLFILIAVFDHCLKQHLWSHITKSHLSRVFLRTFTVLALVNMGLDY